LYTLKIKKSKNVKIRNIIGLKAWKSQKNPNKILKCIVFVTIHMMILTILNNIFTKRPELITLREHHLYIRYKKYPLKLIDL